MTKDILSEVYQGPRRSREEQMRRLRRVMARELTRKQNLYLRAYYFEGKAMTRIAAENGVAVSTVSRTIGRALRRCRRFLEY